MPGVELLSDRSSVEIAADPTVVDVSDAGAIFEALASETARAVLATLYESPAPPSTVADEVETTVQNVHYHLDRLQTAGLVESVDTWYSRKGVEMDVYAPSNAPLVVLAGRLRGDESSDAD